MQNFKEFIGNRYNKNPKFEGFEYTSLFKLLNQYKQPHKIFESLITEEDIDDDIYEKYLNILDESYIFENDEDDYVDQEKQKAIDSGKHKPFYYSNKTSKPFDSKETRNNRNANLTELLPCIWYKMRKGKPFVIKGTTQLYTQINNPKNVNVLKTQMLKTLNYVKEHQNELTDIVTSGNSRYKLKATRTDYDNFTNTNNNIYISLRQDLLLSLDVDKSDEDGKIVRDIDYNKALGSDRAKVISNTYEFENNDGSKITKRFINRLDENLFETNDLIHGLNEKGIKELERCTKTIVDKCIQAFNIYNYITSKLLKEKDVKEKLGTSDRNNINLYWSCSNSSKGEFDIDYGDTTSDLIISTKNGENAGKSIGVSLKAEKKGNQFYAKNYNIQSLLVQLLDFSKKDVDSIVEKLMHELWNMAGYQNLVTKNGIATITEDEFVKWKMRTLESEGNKSMFFKYIHKWNNKFNDAIFKPVIYNVIKEYKKMQNKNNPINYNYETEISNILVKEISRRCNYIYENCYKVIYDEYMEKVANTLNSFFKEQWNTNLKNKRKKIVNNLFGEIENKDVRIIVGTNDFKNTVDATKYNEKIIKYIMENDNSYPILSFGKYGIMSIKFNGLNNSEIKIKMEEFKTIYDKGTSLDKESDSKYFFALNDYIRDELEKKNPEYNEKNNYPYKIFKNIISKNYKYPNKLSFNDKNNPYKVYKFENDEIIFNNQKKILEYIGKMSKVANFPFNSNASVIMDVDNFRKAMRYEINRNN